MAQYLDDDSAGSGLSDGSGNGEPKADDGSAKLADSGLGGSGLEGSLANVDMQSVVHVSEMNREDMTFEEAFRDARQEMGAGHYFEWHGQLYNTYYQDEWEGMSPTEHQEFLVSVYGPDGIPGAGGGSQGGSALAGNEAPARASAQENVAVAALAADDPDVVLDPAVDNDVVAEVTVDDAADTNGNVQMIAQDADMAMAELDGEQVAVFDRNHDDKPDAILNNESNIILIDTDNDHVLDTQATYDPNSRQLSDVQTLDEHLSIDGSMDVLHQAGSPESGLASDDFGADLNISSDNTDYAT